MSNYQSLKTSYIIYRIWNLVDGKSYIGQTRDFKQRKREHFNELNTQKHHNPYLQGAYNKYGSESFKIEIIEGVSTQECLNKRETYWIEKFNSYSNGYNLTLGGDHHTVKTRCKPCVWGGIEYQSIADAARALGISSGAMGERIRNGYTCEGDMEQGVKVALAKGRSKRNRIVRWDNVEYPSLIEASRVTGINYDVLRSRAIAGISSDGDLDKSKFPKVVNWNNIEYPSMGQAARELGVDPKTLTYRIKMGYKCDDDLKVHQQSIEIDGVIFDSIEKARQHHHVARKTIKDWIRSGKARLHSQ